MREYYLHIRKNILNNKQRELIAPQNRICKRLRIYRRGMCAPKGYEFYQTFGAC